MLWGECIFQALRYREVTRWFKADKYSQYAAAVIVNANRDPGAAQGEPCVVINNEYVELRVIDLGSLKGSLRRAMRLH